MSYATPAPSSLLPALSQRWSPRAFADQAISPETLEILFEAARWAPSSRNEQPWAFMIATKENPVAYQNLLNCLYEGNIKWASTAPVLILGIAKLAFALNSRPNRFAMYDLGAAVMNLLTQATELGLYAHQMGGYDVDKARQLYQIPETHELGAVIALGYLGQAEHLPEGLTERTQDERTRHPFKSFVFAQQWGQPSELLSNH